MSSLSRESAVALLTETDLVARALSDLRRGAPIALIGAGDHGGEAALALAAEAVDPQRLAALRSLGFGPGRLAVSAARAATLKARAYDGDLARIALRPDHDAACLHAVADPALDLERPLLGPHATLREGEAGLDRAAMALCKAALLLPAAALWVGPADEIARLAEEHSLTALPMTLADRALTRDQPRADETRQGWREAMSAPLPLAVGAMARLRVFRRVGWEDEHYALEIGAPDRAAPVLTRLHSACLTGDLFGSLKCDCGPQLQGALRAIADAGAGILVYLQQEGRGIGLVNKLRAYRLQEQGFDTVEANHRLGFRDDERLLRDGGDILAALGVRQARLLTNNPAKVAALEAAGVAVTERVPLIIPAGAMNEAYLRVKAAKSGHLL